MAIVVGGAARHPEPDRIDVGLYLKTLGVPELLTPRRDTGGCLYLRYCKAYALLGYLAVERAQWHER